MFFYSLVIERESVIKQGWIFIIGQAWCFVGKIKHKKAERDESEFQNGFFLLKKLY